MSWVVIAFIRLLLRQLSREADQPLNSIDIYNKSCTTSAYKIFFSLFVTFMIYEDFYNNLYHPVISLIYIFFSVPPLP